MVTRVIVYSMACAAHSSPARAVMSASTVAFTASCVDIAIGWSLGSTHLVRTYSGRAEEGLTGHGVSVFCVRCVFFVVAGGRQGLRDVVRGGRSLLTAARVRSEGVCQAINHGLIEGMYWDLRQPHASALDLLLSAPTRARYGKYAGAISAGSPFSRHPSWSGAFRRCGPGGGWGGGGFLPKAALHPSPRECGCPVQYSTQGRMHGAVQVVRCMLPLRRCGAPLGRAFPPVYLRPSWGGRSPISVRSALLPVGQPMRKHTANTVGGIVSPLVFPAKV